jgi:spermidine synthase
LLYLVFFLSGAAGLVYQVVWARLLNEIFGVTVYAVTTVLATFLGGLALGGFVLGGVADRRAEPLRFYGWLEIGIGVTGLAGTWVVRALEPLHVWAANRFAPASAALVAVRVLLASAVILPPTFLMGGTLPAVTRITVDRIQRLGRELSFLYALNTFGAVVGTVVSGFVLIRWVGLHPTLWLAVATNVGVGLAALRLAARRPAGTLAAPAPPAPETPARRARGRAVVAPEPEAAGIGLLVVMALSGFASLGLEVLWTRVLVLVVGTTAYAFVTMLASFLVGITLGGLVARVMIDRLRDLRRAFGWIQLGIAASTLATLPALESLSGGGAERWLDTLGGSWLALVAGRFAVSFAVMLLPTTLIGTTFPLAGKLWARREDEVGGRIGQVYGANTLGNILGAALTGFVLLPAVGLRKGIAVLAVLNLASAAWGLWPSATERARGLGLRGVLRTAPALAGIVASIVLLLGWRPPPLEIEGQQAARRLIYYKEDIVNVVSVYQDRMNPRQRTMLVDGVTIGQSWRGVDEKQQALAHFPFLLLPARPPRTILSIGLGTGILIGETARHPGVERADCLEISPAVIEGARLFASWNGNVLANPTVHVVNDDGVNFLRRSALRYDAIVADAKSRSGHAGNALFYSADYYRACQDHLASDGLMIQWVPLDVPPAELPTIVRSFTAVFPYVYVWVAPPLSSFLVGTNEPLVLDLPYIDRMLADPAAANLRRYGWQDAYGFASLLTADRSGLDPWVGRDGTVDTLEHPVLEFHAPDAFTMPPARRTAENLAALVAVRQEPRTTVRLVGADAATLEAHERASALLLEASMLLQRPDPTAHERGLGLLADALAAAPSHGPLRYAAARAYFEAGSAEQGRGNLEKAVTHYRDAVRLDPGFVEAYGGLGNALMAGGAFDDAITQYTRAAETDPDDARVEYALGVALAIRGRLPEAVGHFQDALRTNPEYAQAREALAKAQRLGAAAPQAMP